MYGFKLLLKLWGLKSGGLPPLLLPLLLLLLLRTTHQFSAPRASSLNPEVFEILVA